MADKQNAFGKELRKLRKGLGFTQKQLAELAGVTASYISQLENGLKYPTDRVIAKLYGPLDISENRLLIKIGKMKMDLAATLATRRKEVPKVLSSLTDDQLEELLTYLAYIQVKASITD